MTKVLLLFRTFTGRPARLLIWLVGSALPPDHADVAALRAIIARITAALGVKASTSTEVILASSGVNVTATGGKYDDDQDKGSMHFMSAEGTPVSYKIPSINSAHFAADHETINTADTAIQDWYAAAEDLFRSPAGGALTFVRGNRTRTKKGGRR